MPWIPMRLRGQTVLARADEKGRLAPEQGRVEIRYKPNDGRAYRALPGNLEPIPGAELLPDEHCGPGEAPPSKEAAKDVRKADARGKLADPKDGTIVAYADGACSGNPGPAGLGIIVYDKPVRELSEFLGEATNNIAELTAILRAAELFEGDPRALEIRTDSQYSIGVLTKGWKAKANQGLVASVKKALAVLDGRVKLTYVPGHAGVSGNERADALARMAIATRKTTGWT
jgi:ribonuclease HI